jgi:hypothetical protein
VTTDDLREVRVLVTVPAAALPRRDGASTTFELLVRDVESGQETGRASHFQRPAAGADPANQASRDRPPSGAKP